MFIFFKSSWRRQNKHHHFFFIYSFFIIILFIIIFLFHYFIFHCFYSIATSFVCKPIGANCFKINFPVNLIVTFTNKIKLDQNWFGDPHNTLRIIALIATLLTVSYRNFSCTHPWNFSEEFSVSLVPPVIWLSISFAICSSSHTLIWLLVTSRKTCPRSWAIFLTKRTLRTRN